MDCSSFSSSSVRVKFRCCEDATLGRDIVTVVQLSETELSLIGFVLEHPRISDLIHRAYRVVLGISHARTATFLISASSGLAAPLVPMPNVW